MNYKSDTAAEQYKTLKQQGFLKLAQEFAEEFGNLNPDGWIYFQDGSKYNTENGGTINPDDIVYHD